MSSRLCKLVGSLCAAAAAASEPSVGPPWCTIDRPCLNNGTCETNTGACACPLGFAGHACERDLMPACRLSNKRLDDGTMPSALCYSKGALQMRSCACLRQCMEHGAWDLTQDFPCFVREKLTEEQQTSAFPARDEHNVKYYRNSGQHEEVAVDEYHQTMIRQNELVNYDVLAPKECDGECNGMGVCQVQTSHPETTKMCFCYYGRDGSDCSGAVPGACMNDCSFNGRCVHGFCSCNPGFFGIDCSIDLKKTASFKDADPLVEEDEPEDDKELRHLARRAAQPATALMRHKIKLSVYVYELPTWLNLAYEIDRFEYEKERNLYSAYWRALSELLHDWDVRTLNPYEANLFYVPAFAYGYLSNGGIPHEYIRRVVRFLQAEYPMFWDRFQGADHIFWYTGDRGVCPMPDDMKHVIWLTHYGQTNYSLSRDPDLRDVGPCFSIDRDVVPPPVVEVAASAAKATYEKGGSKEERNTLLFFAGDTRPHMPYYSQGVRQQIYELYHGRVDAGFVIEHRVDDMVGWMRKSVFCLAPAGHGWGNRIVYAMVSGCIPVIIQDGIHQPYDDVLPYREFAVRLPQSEIENLEPILRSITPEQVRELQHGVQKYHRAFYWKRGDQEGEAYDFLIKSLERRLYNTYSRFKKT